MGKLCQNCFWTPFRVQSVAAVLLVLAAAQKSLQMESAWQPDCSAAHPTKPPEQPHLD
jgi:hypothetical protein